MKPVKFVSVSAVIRNTGKVNIYAVDEEGQLWLGYQSASNGDYTWEKVKGPEIEDPIPNSRSW